MKRRRCAFAACSALLIGAIILVTCRYQNYDADSRQESDSQSEITVIVPDAVPNAINGHTEPKTGNKKIACWHVLLAWPEGITVWVIVLTLLAIAWQSLETAGMTNIAEKNLLSVLRPKIIVRKVLIREGTAIPTQGVPDAVPWTVEYSVMNVGGSHARIEVCNFNNGILQNVNPDELPQIQGRGVRLFALDAGEERILSIPLNDRVRDLFRHLGGKRAQYLAQQDTARFCFWGIIHYTDKLQITRNTSVFRHFQTDGTAKFKPSADADLEYAD